MGKIQKKLDFRKFEKLKRTQFVLNIIAGLTMTFVMHGLESTRWGDGLLNIAFDRFINSEAKEAVKNNEDPRDILILDIKNYIKKDKKNEEDHKINFLSPRDTIAQLLAMALKGDARVVVLDFAFEENDCCYPYRDAQLQKVLSENTNQQTKVIFPVRIDPNNNIQHLIFDDQINKNHPNYLRAISTLYASQEDTVVRLWKTFQRYSDKKILWSIPLLVTAMSTCQGRDLVNIEALVIQQDIANVVYTLTFDTPMGKKKLDLPLHEVDPYLQRIRFRLIPKDCYNDSSEGNIRIPNIENLTPERFKNKIVIIGNSDPQVGDVLSTPVGDMAGMYIQANAIHTMISGNQPMHAPWWVSFILDLFIISGAAYLFHYMDSFWKDLFMTVVVIFGLGAISYFCFFKSFGIVPNYILGIVAIGYIEIMNSLKDVLTKDKQKSGSSKTQHTGKNRGKV